jgi:DNA-binding NarL/FixJ family response regulator
VKAQNIIGLLSDSPMRLAGLVSIFDRPILIGNVPLIPVVCSMQEVLTSSNFDYLILDLHEAGPLLNSIHAIHRARPETQVMVIGPPRDDRQFFEVISAGARAYINLDCEIDTLLNAIGVVVQNGIYGSQEQLSRIVDRLVKVSDSSYTNAPPTLSAREKQVVELILKAQSNSEIARSLGIERRTLTAHVGRLMRKTGAVNRVQLALFMRKNPPV